MCTCRIADSHMQTYLYVFVFMFTHEHTMYRYLVCVYAFSACLSRLPSADTWDMKTSRYRNRHRRVHVRPFNHFASKANKLCTYLDRTVSGFGIWSFGASGVRVAGFRGVGSVRLGVCLSGLVCLLRSIRA